MPDWVEIAKTSDVPEGQVKVVECQGKRLALSHVGKEFFVMEDICTHDQGPLGEGELVGEEVECPRHGARFNVKTGQPVTLPAVLPVQTFPVKVTDDTIAIQI